MARRAHSTPPSSRLVQFPVSRSPSSFLPDELDDQDVSPPFSLWNDLNTQSGINETRSRAVSQPSSSNRVRGRPGLHRGIPGAESSSNPLSEDISFNVQRPSQSSFARSALGLSRQRSQTAIDPDGIHIHSSGQENKSPSFLLSPLPVEEEEEEIRGVNASAVYDQLNFYRSQNTANIYPQNGPNDAYRSTASSRAHSPAAGRRTGRNSPSMKTTRSGTVDLSVISTIAGPKKEVSNFEEVDRFWDKYTVVAKPRDEKMLRHWNRSIDVLLVFAALFSAVLTAFILEFYRLLVPDSEKTSAELLQTIAQSVQILVSGVGSVEDGGSLPDVDKNDVPRLVIWANGLWFFSLASSLGVAMTAIIVKQWIQFYERDIGSGSAFDYSQRRQYRYNAVIRWAVPGIIIALPIAMHSSLMLFLAGLVMQLWVIRRDIAYVVLGGIAMYGVPSVLFMLMPLFSTSCPYKNPTAFMLRSIWYYVRVASLWSILRTGILLNTFLKAHTVGYQVPLEHASSKLKSVSSSSHADPEAAEIKRMQSELTIDAVLWLIESSQDRDVVDLALESISLLPRSPEMLKKFHAHGIPELLVSRALMGLPELDSKFWNHLPLATEWVETHDERREMLNSGDEDGRISEREALVASLLHLLQHPSTRDIIAQYPLSSPGGKPEEADGPWFFDKWVLLYRKLYQLPTLSLTDVNKHCLALASSFLCAEVTYYHLSRPEVPCYAQTRPSQPESDILLERNVFADLQALFSMSVSGEIKLENHSLAMIIDTLLFVLSDMHEQTHLHLRQDTLLLLCKFLGTGPHDSKILRKVSAGIQMFTCPAGQQNVAYAALVEEVLLSPSKAMPRKDIFATIKAGINVLSTENTRDKDEIPAMSTADGEQHTEHPRVTVVSRIMRLRSPKRALQTDVEMGQPGSDACLAHTPTPTTLNNEVQGTGVPEQAGPHPKRPLKFMRLAEQDTTEESQPTEPSSSGGQDAASAVLTVLQHPKTYDSAREDDKHDQTSSDVEDRSTSTVLLPAEQTLIPNRSGDVPIEPHKGDSARNLPDVDETTSLLPMTLVAKEVFNFISWCNENDEDAGSVFMALPPVQTEEILGLIMQTDLAEYRSCAWLVQLLCGWSEGDKLSLSNHARLAETLQTLLRGLYLTRPRDFSRQILPLLRSKLQKLSQHSSEYLMICFSLSKVIMLPTELGDTVDPRLNRRRLIRRLVASGVMEDICHSFSSAVLGSQPNNATWSFDIIEIAWLEVYHTWKYDYQKHPRHYNPTDVACLAHLAQSLQKTALEANRKADTTQHRHQI